MRIGVLAVALVLSLALSVVLTAILHTFVVIGLLPLLFVPFAIRRRG